MKQLSHALYILPVICLIQYQRRLWHTTCKELNARTLRMEKMWAAIRVTHQRHHHVQLH